MGSIVFGTIAENIKSFFAREEELMHQPSRLPEVASEIYEKPQIIQRPLPEKKQLPFSPDELRTALKEQPKPALTQPLRKSEEIEHDITHEISAFESALTQVHNEPQAERTPPQVANAPTVNKSSAQPPSPSAPFFDEFEQFLVHEDLEAEGLLGKDILHRMREFHKHQQEGKEFYVYSKDVKQGINRKLRELKTLEHEWFHTKQQLDELEKGMSQIEHEIETRGQELKILLEQERVKSQLEQQVQEGHEFILYDGRKLRSLLDLKIALRTMPDTVFAHHVTQVKNDFATWIEAALHDKQTADQFKSTHDKHAMELLLSRIGR